MQLIITKNNESYYLPVQFPKINDKGMDFAVLLRLD